MLALIFSIAKGFGIQDKIEPLLLEKTVGGEIAADLIPRITEYVANTNVTALGSIGLLFIVYTAISMLGQIEASFNRIWGIKKSRSPLRKATDYLAIIIIGPLLLAVSLGLSATLGSTVFTRKLLEIGLFAGTLKLFFFALPWMTNIAVMTLIAMIIPNTAVRFTAALPAGIITGSLWQITQFIFIDFQVGVARYNAVYGTFASVPIFMIWLQASWILVLLGGVISFACQNAATFHPLEFEDHISFASREKISLAVLLAICRTYDLGEGASTPTAVSNRLGLSEDFVRHALAGLLDRGAILLLREEGKDGYVPARPSQQLKIAHFFKEMEGEQADGLEFHDQDINAAIKRILLLRQQALEANFADAGMDMPP
jgi:membrane protein